MNSNRAYTEMLVIAVVAIVVLLVSMGSVKSPVAKIAATPVSSHVLPAASAASAHLHTVSAQASGQWLRADAQDAPVQQTRWVF